MVYQNSKSYVLNHSDMNIKRIEKKEYKFFWCQITTGLFGDRGGGGSEINGHVRN